MAKPLNVYIVDDSAVQTDIARALLEKAGHTVITNHSSVDALQRPSPPQRPDCVLMDIMMPELDGYELCRRLRAMPELAGTKLVMMSTKAYPFERKRAFELGANGYFVKPLHPATFVAELERLVADTLTLTLLGRPRHAAHLAQGLAPLRRQHLVREPRLPDGRLFIFDAGTGIKALSDALLAAKRTRIDGKILISHPHWDHINALPFFAPFYVQGNQFEICGASHGDVTDARPGLGADGRRLLPRHRARVRRRASPIATSSEGEFEIGGVTVRTMLLSHPGNCLGYRLQHGGRSICYVTDNELFDADSPSSTPRSTSSAWPISRATPTSSSPTAPTPTRSTRGRSGWGHSSVSQVAELAWRARVEDPLPRPPRPGPERRRSSTPSSRASASSWPSRARRPTWWRRPSAWRSRSRRSDPPGSASVMQAAGSIASPTASPTGRRCPTGVTTRSTTSLSATAIS